ncbi:MAG: LON peptidase substrate-binding domain-containing protein [Bryobacteraceae bacterium]|nr:LON peptidase substrate-binding domain-containing protein [Bryobacteraceae bacterium]
MQPEMLPLFPLGVVLFPRTQIPLHIFEDRYKEMIGEALRNKTEFGVVLAADRGIVGTGCTAVVEKVTQAYPDGRMDIVVMGVRRFEIRDLDTEKAYLRGSVDFFNDEETDEPGEDLRERALQGYGELKEVLGPEPAPDPKLEDPQLSFQLAQLVPDLEFRQKMLGLRSESERLRQLVEFLPAHLEQQRHAGHVRAVAPWNGRGPALGAS